MKKLLFSAGLWIVLTALAMAQPLQRSTPAAEGVETKAVAAYFDSLLHIPQTEIHHAMVLRHGKVIGELHPAPFRTQDAHTLYSESKTVAALAVGLCVDDRLLRVTDRLITFFPDKLPEHISENLANITIHDLLTMESGIKPDWNMRSHYTDWVWEMLHKEVTDAPGTKYQYDSMCTYLLSAIVQRATGKTMMQLLTPRIFAPMGITDAQWEECPHGINTGGWGLRLSAESQAKIGQLLLQKGEWNGHQLVSKQWVEAATSRQVYPYEKGTASHTKSPGYGYQIWMSEHPGSYRADGALGQFVVMLPDKDMVVVINGASFQAHFELSYIWKVLLPGVKNAPIAEDVAAQKRLERLCHNATLGLPKGKATDKKRSGSTVVVGEGEKALRLTFMPDGTLQYTYGGRTITAIHQQWHYETLDQDPPYSITAIARLKGLTPAYTSAAAYAWKGNELTIRTYWVDFISGETIKVKFVDSDKAQLTVQRNYQKQAAVSAKPLTYSITQDL
ncbi:MAG: serine hydrolase domain-containing protein [Sodaliphilus sp.]